MKFWVITLLVAAAVLLICPAEISGKKYQKDEHEKKIFTRTSTSTLDNKNVHAKHPKEREVLIRNTRGAKANDNSPAGVGDVIADNAAPASCQYVKGNWSECDATTNIRSRVLTLKDGDNKECVPTRTIQKKCKKAMMNHGCRYDKGTWSECLNGEQTRLDTLKTSMPGVSSPPSSTCEPTRSIKKSCKGKKSKTNKERKNNKLTGRKGRGGAQH